MALKIFQGVYVHIPRAGISEYIQMLVCPPTTSLHVFENIQMLLCLPTTSRLHENIKMQVCPLPTRRDESQQIAALQLRVSTTTRCF